MRLRCCTWVARVPTDLNISDGPSRPDDPSKLLPLLQYSEGFTWVSPDPCVPVWAIFALEHALART